MWTNETLHVVIPLVMLVDVLFAPVYHRVFFTGQPLTEQFVAALIRRIQPPCSV